MSDTTWCGGADHEPFQHGPLRRRARWWEERYPFREPADMIVPVTITLTDDEIDRAERRANMIMKADVSRGWTMYFQPGGGETRLDVNIRGCGAELAASRATGLKIDWSYLPATYRRRDKRPDMGKRTEVRNARKSPGLLWASETDPVSRVFLLVTGMMPTFQVHGWLEGTDLMEPLNWRDKPRVRYPGYFADSIDLNCLPLPPDA